LTYLYLTARRNESGHAWPSAPTIAIATGYSLDAVKHALAGLRRRGLIVRAGLADPRLPQYSAVRWFLPPVVSPTTPLDEPVVSPTTPPAVLKTGSSGVAHDTHKKQGSNSPRKQTPLPPNSAEVQRVFDTWIESTGRTGRTRLDGKRRKAIQRALSDYPVPDVLDAVRGWVNDSWPERVRFNDLTQLLRDAEHIEKFRRLWQEGAPPVRIKPRGAQAVANAFPDVPDDLGPMLGWGNGQKPEPSVIETKAIEEPR
jgi:hypothetical protein